MTSLDHVGYVVPQLAPLRAAMQALGFTLTEPRELRRMDPATGASVSLQQWSCHAVFEQGYLELTSVESRDPAHHLAAYLDRGPGLHILALGSTQIGAEHARCVAAGIATTAPARATRRIEYGTRQGDAAFEWFMFAAPESPEGLLCYAHNLTPELVYQPVVQQHENGALALEEVVITAAQPGQVATRYARLLGVAAEPQSAGWRISLGDGALSICAPAAFAARFGVAADGAAAAGRFAAIVIRSRDAGQCARRLEAAGVAVSEVGKLLVTRCAAAGGSVLAFR